VTSTAWGETVGGCVGLAYLRHDEAVRQDWLDRSEFAVDVAGDRHPVRLSLRAPL
jgi:glycine cleavage system aminomethyltransferase T